MWWWNPGPSTIKSIQDQLEAGRRIGLFALVLLIIMLIMIIVPGIQSGKNNARKMLEREHIEQENQKRATSTMRSI